MSRPVNVERVVNSMDVSLKRLERPQIEALRTHLNESYRRLKADLTRLYAQAALGRGRQPLEGFP